MAKAKTRRPNTPMGARKLQTAPAGAGQTVTVDTPAAPKKRTSIPQFASQVQAEARKIVWPSRKETWITSVMVFMMVVIATVFFAIVDFGLTKLSQVVLAIGQ